MVRAIVSLFIPCGLVLVAAVVVATRTEIPEPSPDFIRFAPTAMCLLGACLACHFRRSRLFLACAALSLVDWTLMGFGDAALSARPTIWAALGILIPLAFLLLALVSDRPVLSSVSLTQILLLTVLPFLVAWLCLPPQGAIAAQLQRELVSVSIAWGSPIPQLGWAVFGAALLVLLFVHLLDSDVVASGLIWALGGVFLALHSEPQNGPARLYLAASAVVLVLSHMESFYRLAFRDELTLLPSRRALTEALHELPDRHCIAMADIDHFKRFNDSFGHEVGDQALRMVASTLARVTGGGRVFRFGGEEFTILFPGKDLKAALPHLEALRMAVEERPFTLRLPGPRKRPKQGAPADRRPREQVAVTVSIGVAEGHGGAGGADRTLREADDALYRAKDAGRNRVSA